MRHTRRLLISLLISFSLAGLVLLTGRAQKAPPAEEQEPPGDWSLSIGVYTGPGYESLPVMADSVKSVGSKGLAVTEVTLKNNTTKFVKQVRLQWQVSERPDLGREKEDTRVILVHGRTPRITVDLSPGEERLLEYLVVSFA